MEELISAVDFGRTGSGFNVVFCHMQVANPMPCEWYHVGAGRQVHSRLIQTSVRKPKLVLVLLPFSVETALDDLSTGDVENHTLDFLFVVVFRSSIRASSPRPGGSFEYALVICSQRSDISQSFT